MVETQVVSKLITMSKIRPGHKANSFLNGEWSKHVKRWEKKATSSKRRIRDRILVRKKLIEYFNEEVF